MIDHYICHHALDEWGKKKKVAFGIASDRSFPDLLFPHNMIFFSAPIPTKDLIQQPQDLPNISHCKQQLNKAIVEAYVLYRTKIWVRD